MGCGDYITVGTLHIQIALRNLGMKSLPPPTTTVPWAGRLGINEVAANISGGGGGQIKLLEGEDVGERGSLAYNTQRGSPVSMSQGWS